MTLGHPNYAPQNTYRSDMLVLKKSGVKMCRSQEKDGITIYFKVTPNPFTSSTTIQFSLYQDTYVSVDLYNYTGVKLKSIYNGNVSAREDVGLHLSPDASMGTGMYFLVLRTNHGIETRRIILTR
ncbi:MAG: T9SS type A sorting domain-containing protein [Bacteroidota bacterium]|nr:T9SS type A sorting domain-containing protein [Bacteroidota bacterium]